jgi:hypothetical protein
MTMTTYEDAARASRQAMNGALKSFSAMTAGMQQIASETSDFTRRSYEQQTTMFGKLMQAGSIDRSLEIQNEFAKSFYRDWVSQATRMSEICADMTREAWKPVEQTGLPSYAQGAGQSAPLAEPAIEAAPAIEKQPAD